MADVVLEDLVKDYGDAKTPIPAVKGINLHVKTGEFMVLVGPSGCGKSTTLRMIAGLEDITGGTVRIGDQVVNDVLPKNRGIAMVFQNYALYPHMTVYDNMSFGLKLQKMPKEEIRQRVEDAATILGLEDYLKRKPRQLSGGQRQRVAVGRAIVRQPKVFLFDEPLSNLDAKMRVQMRSELTKLHQRLGATMIYVTHDQTEAMTMGDRICVMNHGEIMQVDRPLDLYQRPRNLFAAGFIGSPPMNFFPGRARREGDTIHFREDGEAPFKVSLSASAAPGFSATTERKLVLGVRPEDLTETDTPGPHSFKANIEMTEPMGAETYLYLRTASNQFIGRLPGFREATVGEEVQIDINPANIRLFDPESGAVLD